MLFIILISSQSSYSQYYIPTEYLDGRWYADSLFKTEDYKNALPEYKNICESDFHRRLDYMYLAKCFSETNDLENSKHSIQIAIDNGLHFNNLADTIYCYTKEKNLYLDYLLFPEFENQRKQLIENTKAYFENQNIDSTLAKELILRFEIDLKISKIIEKFPEDDSLSVQMQNIRTENQKMLAGIIERDGFPTIYRAGEAAVYAAFVIVQHCDFDIEFQEKCLKLMIENYKNGEIPAVCIAYLQDRILINRNLPQIFGTQIFHENEEFSLKPVIDEKLLEKRREVMQLNKINQYLVDIKESIE